MTRFYKGVAGARGYNPTKIVIHNDAGSINATASFYRNWLPTRDAENGFAHYYCASDDDYEAESPLNKAWHCANVVGNRDYIGIEVCQQLGDDATFLANEQRAFKLAATLCKRFNIAVTVDNFPLHQELSSTSCPSKSLVLHGATRQALKEYYVAQVKKYMTDSTTSTTATQTNQFGGISMFTFQEKGSKAIYGVWGNKKFLFANTSELKDFRNIVKDTTGRTCKHYMWEKGHTPFGVVDKMIGE